MGGFLSLLFFAVFFYVMMRFGCGAHSVLGHGSSHEHGDTDKETDILIDPVCGNEVGVNEGYSKMHNNALERFCSKKCLDQFDEDPGRYTATSLETKP